MKNQVLYFSGLLAVFGMTHTPVRATVQILGMRPSLPSPEPIGKTITWAVTATDTNRGPLTFQFSVAPGKQAFSVVHDFDMGKQVSGVWASRPFVWTTIAGEGSWRIQVIAKDFASKETAVQTATFELTSRVKNGHAAVTTTANPLVALFSSPPCLTGSFMRVTFANGSGAPRYTNWKPCNSLTSMNVYVAGMLPSTTYNMNYQIATGLVITNGPNPLTFATGALPANLTLPTFTEVVPPGPETDIRDSTIVHSFTQENQQDFFTPIATDLIGRVTWYYSSASNPRLTRMLHGGYMLTLEDGAAWDPVNTTMQYVREVDLAGNIIRETNIGVVSQQLLAIGVTDAAPCNQVPTPPPVGSACLNQFHHEAMRLPNGYTAVLGRLEKLFPRGTQGSQTSQPLDVLGDMVIVLNENWQVVWYFEEFQKLNVNHAATLGETCVNGVTSGPGFCHVTLALADQANDWTHTNSITYISSSGDLLVSVRNQDHLLKIDYGNGAGSGKIIWLMGRTGDFTFNNINKDPFPWFSHQHYAQYQPDGALILFDNGNTRVAPPPIGLGGGNSRGMALLVDEIKMVVTPLLSVDLGTYAPALGSAQLLSNGNYFFQPGLPTTYNIEIQPTSGTTSGTQVYNLSTPASCYRAWRLPFLY